jgi:hypothetical protein
MGCQKMARQENQALRKKNHSPKKIIGKTS